MKPAETVELRGAAAAAGSRSTDQANGLECHIVLIGSRPCHCFLPLRVRQLLVGQFGRASARYCPQRSAMPVPQTGSGPLINRATGPSRIGSAALLVGRGSAQA